MSVKVGTDIRSQGELLYIRRLSSLSLYIYLSIEKHTKMYIPLCMHYVIIGAMILKKILILDWGSNCKIKLTRFYCPQSKEVLKE